jgi:hypothetical protein
MHQNLPSVTCSIPWALHTLNSRYSVGKVESCGVYSCHLKWLANPWCHFWLWLPMQNYISLTHFLPRHNYILCCPWNLLWYSGKWNIREYPSYHTTFWYFYSVPPWMWLLAIQLSVLCDFEWKCSKSPPWDKTKHQSTHNKLSKQCKLVILHPDLPHCETQQHKHKKCQHSWQ